MQESNRFTASNRWAEAPIEEVAQWSPQVALARVWRAPMAPRLLNITATFNDTTTVTGALSWSVDGEPARLDQFGIVQSIVYEVDQPNAQSGQSLKPITDYFFNMQSGITATMSVVGAPRYVPAADFTPLRTLLSAVAEMWPMGWVITYTQSIQMQFQPSALLTPPATLTVSFRLWQVYGTTDFIGMTDSDAFRHLEAAGYKCQQAKSAPVCRS